mmetsp:Transcript_5908/g.17257  ORF Transcript_5908/g.17257 Transcript_5908/m.17257 type:complete len:210 (-) Transcript_5908:627-1256(-)
MSLLTLRRSLRSDVGWNRENRSSPRTTDVTPGMSTSRVTQGQGPIARQVHWAAVGSCRPCTCPASSAVATAATEPANPWPTHSSLLASATNLAWLWLSCWWSSMAVVNTGPDTCQPAEGPLVLFSPTPPSSASWEPTCSAVPSSTKAIGALGSGTASRDSSSRRSGPDKESASARNSVPLALSLIVDRSTRPQTCPPSQGTRRGGPTTV